MEKESFGFRLFETVLGLAMAGVAFYMIVKAGIGLSPWDAFAMAVSYYIPVTYGQSVQLVGVAVLAADLWLLMRYSGQFPVWVKAVTLLAGVVFLLSAGYVYPLQARFENTVWKTLINSCVMALAHLPVSLAVAALNLLGPVLAMTAPGLFFRSIPVWLLFGAALTALLNTLLLRGVFCKYIC